MTWWWSWITKVFMNHPLDTMGTCIKSVQSSTNVCTNIHGNPSNTCWDISAWLAKYSTTTSLSRNSGPPALDNPQTSLWTDFTRITFYQRNSAIKKSLKIITVVLQQYFLGFFAHPFNTAWGLQTFSCFQSSISVYTVICTYVEMVGCMFTVCGHLVLYSILPEW